MDTLTQPLESCQKEINKLHLKSLDEKITCVNGNFMNSIKKDSQMKLLSGITLDKKSDNFANMTKQCRICGLVLSFDEFGTSKNGKFGLHSYCNKCTNLRSVNKYKKDIDKSRTKYRSWYSKNKEKIKLNYKHNINRHWDNQKKYEETLKGKIGRWKSAAKRRHIEFNVTIEYLKSLPMICHYTGAELTFKHCNFNTVSLDRLDSSKGYVDSNVVLCCQMLNKMKQDMSYEMFLETCKAVTNHSK